MFVGGVNSPVRAFRAVGGTPLFFESARGAMLTDVDGKRYVDYVGSWGPMIVGHAHPKVVAAAKRAVERGSSFGYGDLVVDMRAFPIMAASGWPVVFDITDSLQQPGGRVTGGRREFAATLARAAVAAGADAVFFEAHPDPAHALSDAATMLPLEAVAPLLEGLVRLRDALVAVEREL